MDPLAVTRRPLPFGRALRSVGASIWGFAAGLAAGMRAYRIYTELDGFSDGTLANRGLNRADLARVAVRRAGLINQ